jgi:hypothetical protein
MHSAPRLTQQCGGLPQSRRSDSPSSQIGLAAGWTAAVPPGQRGSHNRSCRGGPGGPVARPPLEEAGHERAGGSGAPGFRLRSRAPNEHQPRQAYALAGLMRLGLHSRRRSGSSVRKHGLPVVLHRDDDPSHCIGPVEGSVQLAEASDQSLGEVSIPCRRGDRDGVFRSSRMIPGISDHVRE